MSLSSNYVLRTVLGLPTCTNQQVMSTILAQSTRPTKFKETDWSKFQTSLEAGLPSNPDITNEGAIDASVKKLSRAISKA